MATPAHYPVARKMELKLTGAATDAIYVDQSLSLDNHRLYRQGRVYSVKIDINPENPRNIEVYCLPDTWYVRKAWLEAYMRFLEATKAERSLVGKGAISRWHDFRVKHGLVATPGVPTQRIHDGTGTDDDQVDGGGEYKFPHVAGNDGDASRGFKWLGISDVANFGIIKEYSDTGNTDADPANTVSGGYTLLVDETVEVADLASITTDGNQPPYDPLQFDHLFPFRKVAELSNAPTAATGRTSSGFFNAPAGLVLIRGAATNDQLYITFQSGDYKGVKAPSMTTSKEMTAWKNK